jgi:hypothetical protein
MNRGRTPSEFRRRRSSGNVIVESVFTMLPTFAMILMFVDMSLMLFRRATLQNAVREGCRYDLPDCDRAGSGCVHLSGGPAIRHELRDDHR